jgi:hypothetical protein
LADPITTAMLVATVAGSVMEAGGTIAAGNAAKQQADYEAAQLDIRAKEDQAQGQQEAKQLREQKERALSSLTARSAASGFSATDPTSLALADEIERYGTLQEQMAQYGGKSRRTGTEAQATGARISGKAAKKGSKLSAAATILGGISSGLSKYNTGSGGGGSSSGSYRYS